LLGGVAANAQFTSGMEGTVQDASGAAISGATVIVTNAQGVLQHFQSPKSAEP
jgi:hypothetical protein